MSQSRLTHALLGGELTLPETGRIALFHPRAEADLSALPKDRCQVIQPFRPDFEALSAAGFDCAVAPEGEYAASIVFLPRAKPLARLLVAQAVEMSLHLVVVDGQKTDGIESVLKECRKRGDVSGAVSKAHGKLFWLTPGGDFSDWKNESGTTIEGGFTTMPGVFSADGVDPASALLAGSLPEKMGRDVADLGAGWGYLSARMLERDGIETLHLVEADHRALDCARKNIQDDRARFHWADATNWHFPSLMDAVVMNPPFHTGRAAKPELGKAFIAAAAAMLKPGGHLWLVANRHLPYETALAARFGKVEEVAGDNRFKILHAERPSRKRV